jgi:hypothetical protein
VSRTVFDITKPWAISSPVLSGDVGAWYPLIPVDLRDFCVQSFTWYNADTDPHDVTIGIGEVEAMRFTIPARAGLDGNPPIDVVKLYLATTDMDLLVLPGYTPLNFRPEDAPSDSGTIFSYNAWGGYF